MTAGDTSSGQERSAHLSPRRPFARILRNGVFNAAGIAISMPLNIVAVFVLARRLGPQDFGLYYMVFTAMLVVYSICELGISTLLTRRIAQNFGKLKQITSQGMGLLVCTCGLSALVLIAIGMGLAYWHNRPQLITLFALGALTCASRQAQEFAAAVFRGLETFGYENLARILQNSLNLALVVLTVQRGDHDGLVAALAALAVSSLATPLFLFWLLQRQWHCLGLRFDWKLMRTWARQAAQIGFGDLVRRLTWQIDTVLLGLLATADVVGIYSVAYRPLQPLQFLPVLALSVLFPSYSRLARTNPPLLRSSFAQSVRLMWLVSLPIVVCGCLFARPFIELLAGRQYLAAADLLPLLIWIVAATFISTQFRFFLIALGQQHRFTRLAVLVFVVQVALEMALIPFLFAYGACIGSLVGEAFFVVAGLWICRTVGAVQFEWREMARGVPAALFLAGALWTVRDQAWPLLILAGALGSLFYALLCVMFGALRASEVSQFKQAVRQQLGGGRRAGLVSAPVTGPGASDISP